MSQRAFTLGAAVLLMAVCLAGGQPSLLANPAIGYIYPAGGTRGSSFKVTIGGQGLAGGTNLICSHEGFTARFVRHDAPIAQGQLNNLRDEMRALVEKRKAANPKPWKRRNVSEGGKKPSGAVVWTAEDTKAMMEIQHKIETFQRQPTSPAIADTVIMQMTLHSNVPPGSYQVRLQTARGMSNPLTFRVGALPEVTEPPPAQENYAGQFRKSRIANEQTPIKSRPEIRVTLPSVVNGQVFPSEVDRYRFYARKGQQLVAAVSARDLIPFLADAVPGWFQATLSLSDSKGKELAYADDFRFQPDPVLHFEVPADGEYVIAIKDSIFRGREDFIYRLSIGELPFITSIFPLGCPKDSRVVIELTGWNLPQTTLTNSSARTGTHSVSVASGNRFSNILPFRVEDYKEVLEKEPNNNATKAQSVRLPVVINGRINYQGDLDVFRFEAGAGDEIVIESTARRLGSPLDSAVHLLDAAGNQVGFNDDAPEQGIELQTHRADSFLRVKIPAAGVYLAQISDTQRQGGSEFAYRLRISPPRPDFDLWIVPATINGRPGLSAPVTLQAHRKDGFNGEIHVSLIDAPPGFELSGGVIPAGQDAVRATLSLPAQTTGEPVRLEVTGRAAVGGETLVRRALPADDMMQAFFYRHLVPASDLTVFVGGKSWMRNPLTILGKGPLRIPAGGTARVTVSGPARALADRLHLTLNKPPDGIEIEKVATVRDQAEITFKADAKLAPGQKGNLIVELFPAENAGGKAKGKGGQARNKIALGVLPAIAYEVVAAR